MNSRVRLESRLADALDVRVPSTPERVAEAVFSIYGRGRFAGFDGQPRSSTVRFLCSVALHSDEAVDLEDAAAMGREAWVALETVPRDYAETIGILLDLGRTQMSVAGGSLLDVCQQAQAELRDITEQTARQLIDLINRGRSRV